MADLKTTPLTEIHKKLEARMVEFAGYNMPIQYTSIIEEHKKVRREVGLFDLCHMGRIAVKGPDSLDYLQNLVTNNLAKMAPGDARYALVCNERGGVRDDVIVYNRDEGKYLVVCNASNREKITDWFEKHREGYEVEVTDESEKMGMIAIQGVNSEAVVNKLLSDDISDLNYYACTETTVLDDEPVIVARTGYTGEDGFELYLDGERLPELWEKSIVEGKEEGITPVGLGARDTLRLEAAMPLYGQEITEETNPLEAGLRFAVKLKKGDFIGREALLEIKEQGLERKLVCMEIKGRRIARTGAKIFDGDKEVGEVTSGTFSPTLEKSIAMGYVPKSLSKVGSELEVAVGSKKYALEVIKRPFYKREK